MTSAIAIIPARYGSTRYPGKPLLRDTGKFLIQHVCERVAAAKRIARCVVATDDERIFAAVRGFGGEVVMTRADHPSGTDRLAEVVRGITTGIGSQNDDLVLNVQGDEPEIEPAYLDQLVERMDREALGGSETAPPYESERDVPASGDESCVRSPIGLDISRRREVFTTPLAGASRSDAPRSVSAEPSSTELLAGCPIGTLACPFPPDVNPRDTNCVKVVFDRRQRALYFSRSLLPYPRDASAAAAPNVCYLHLGVYAYRRRFLLEYASWPTGVLEAIEKLEQLRVLEQGYDVAVELVPRAAPGVDTPADYDAFVGRWRASGGLATRA